MFRHIITLLMFSCISLNVNAQVIALKNDHPDQYVVVKGDTLWGISGKFLKDPWQWPSIWKLNREQIKNPHWIYPGDVVVLDMSSGTPQLRISNGQTVTLTPGAVEEPLSKSAIPTIQLSVIAPYLNQPLVIEKDQLDKSPRILAAQDERVIMSPGTRFYINNIEDGSALNWYIYRPGDTLVDPETKKTLGVEATYLGDARITKYGAPASADISSAKEEIFVKDRLVPTDDTIITNFVPHAPDTPVAARIIKIYGGVAEAGPQSIVSINKGSSDGLEVGHVLAINRYGPVIKDPEYQKDKDAKSTKPANGLDPDMVKLPDERIGLLMVFRVFDKVSYGLVMQASLPINTLDALTTP